MARKREKNKNNPKNRPAPTSVLRYALILLGSMTAAFAVSVFYVPNKIVGGGVSGAATILYHTLGIPASVSVLVINAVLLIFALFLLGRRFVRDTLVGTLLFSLFIQAFSYLPPVTDNIFLATIFGAALYGGGIGLVLAQRASTGGTDILGRLLQRFFPHMRIGTALLAVDSAVILASLICFGEIDLALYGIIALRISSFAVNWLIQRLNVSRLAFVVTNDGVRLSKELIAHSPRGVTIINATGGYTMTNKQVLMCALKERELEQFEKRVQSIDPEAFVIFAEAQQIVGNGFRVYN